MYSRSSTGRIGAMRSGIAGRLPNGLASGPLRRGLIFRLGTKSRPYSKDSVDDPGSATRRSFGH